MDGREANQAEINRRLQVFLNSAGVYESDEMKEKRREAVVQMTDTVKRWIKWTAQQYDYSEDTANANMYTFGSYGLDLYGPGADIDVLCVAPCYASREYDFFVTLRDMFSEMCEVTEVDTIPDAFVPILSFNFNDIPIDMAYAAIALEIVPETLDFSNDSTLFQLHDMRKSIPSVNGYRTTEKIRTLIPHFESYSTAFRCVKLWAKRRGVYSNVCGFLGGINLELLLCRVCESYPEKPPSLLVWLFFHMYSNWAWPSPIKFYPIIENTEDEGEVRVWTPMRDDKVDIMPIVTPVFPSSNSTFNVSPSTLGIMKRNFQDAKNICQDIVIKQSKDWSALFDPFPFFKAYQNYFQIQIKAANEDHLRRWKGFVVSKLRHLTLKIEQHTQQMLHAHINPQPYTDPSTAEADVNQCFFFMGVQRHKAVYMPPASQFQLTDDIIEFRRAVLSAYKNHWSAGMEIYVRHLTPNDLPSYVFNPPTDSPNTKRKRPHSDYDEAAAKRSTCNHIIT